MEWKSESVISKTKVISRRIFCSFFLFLIVTGLMNEFAEIYDPKFLGLLVPFIGSVALVSLAISGLMPGILVLLGVPWLAHAWLRGINPIWVSSTPWIEMSAGRKVWECFTSILLSGFMVFAIISFIRDNFPK